MESGRFTTPMKIPRIPLMVGLACTSLFAAVAMSTTRQEASIKIEKDIPYGEGGDERKLDLYLPEKQGFSTIVFIYGGGWHSGSRKGVAPIGEKLRSLGYGCALPSHRLSPKDKFPAQVEDVAAAFAWVKRHIAEKGGNPNRVFLMRHSSGATVNSSSIIVTS